MSFFSRDFVNEVFIITNLKSWLELLNNAKSKCSCLLAKFLWFFLERNPSFLKEGKICTFVLITDLGQNTGKGNIYHSKKDKEKKIK